MNFMPFALNALLLPLLDDDVPSRWTDPSLSLDCNNGRVTIDGHRLDVGAPVPGAFTVRWHMERCTFLGRDLELSGEVELRVKAAADAYVAHVHPRGLRVSTANGAQTLTEPFEARLGIDVTQRP